MAYRRTRRHRRRTSGRKSTTYKRPHRRQTRKMRGGRNLGANHCDPNFSIYNSNFLKLFPYKA